MESLNVIWLQHIARKDDNLVDKISSSAISYYQYAPTSIKSRKIEENDIISCQINKASATQNRTNNQMDVKDIYDAMRIKTKMIDNTDSKCSEQSTRLGCLMCRQRSDNSDAEGFYLYTFDTYYSKNSSDDNPIVAVAIESAFHSDTDDELKDVHNYYREIEVNKINPRNSTLLEMHILLSHKEYQSCKTNHQDYGNPWDAQAFYDGMEAGVFPYFVDNIEECMDIKKDWIQEALKVKFSDSQLAEKSVFKEIKEAIIEYLQKLAENIVDTEKKDEEIAVLDSPALN